MFLHSGATAKDVRFQLFRNALTWYLNDYEVSGEIFYLEKAEAEIKNFIEKVKRSDEVENNN